MRQSTTVFVEILLPVFAVLLLGYYAGRQRILERAHVTGLNIFLMQFALPCSLFLGVARMPASALRHDWPLPTGLAVAMLLTYALTFLIEKSKVSRSPLEETAVLALTVSFANNVAIGFPLLLGVFGPQGVVPVASAVVSGSLIVTPLTLILLEYRQKRNSSGASTPTRAFSEAALASVRRPIVWAPLLALLVPAFGLRVPLWVTTTLDVLGRTTIGVALFVTGVLVAFSAITVSRSVVWGVALKNLVQPLLLVAVLLLLHTRGDLLREAFLLAAVPAGFFGTVFGARHGVSSTEASSTLVFSTLLGVVTLPLAIVISRWLPQ